MPAVALPRRLFAALGALAMAITLSACNKSAADAPRAIKKSTTSSSSSSTSSTTSTTLKKIEAPAGLGQGSRGPQVQQLESQLAAQKYDPGKIDGYFDSSTYHAVIAFQKVHGLARTGRATDDVLSLLSTSGPPGPMLPGGGATRVEVDLKRQILQLYVGGSLYKVVDVSTGSGKKYCVPGDGCAMAVTPGGSFKVFFRRSGWRTSKLGKLYNPLYFNGGIAIHGEPAVPPYPASHGCVRIPMYVSEWFPSVVPNGTPVYVIGGATAAVPFNEPAPNGQTGTGGPATTTTAPPATTTTTKPGFPPPPSTTTSTSTTTTTIP